MVDSYSQTELLWCQFLQCYGISDIIFVYPRRGLCVQCFWHLLYGSFFTRFQSIVKVLVSLWILLLLAALTMMVKEEYLSLFFKENADCQVQ